MVALPIQSPTIEAVYRHYETENEKEPRRTYLGGSIIGEECSRALWLNFRWADEPKFPGRILRLFETGHLSEARIIANLRAIGCEVWDKDPETDEQFRYSTLGGHLSTGADGIVLGLLESPKTPHLFEGKTKNKRLYAVLKKDGIEDKHVAQMQLLMGMAKLKRAVYIVQNKDTDDLHLERIKFESKRYKALLLKAERIIFADSPPMRIAEDPASWLCKWCDYSDVCWGRKVAAYNCRTCAHSTPLREGGWDCAKDESCENHLFIPPLLDWAGQPVDGGEGWVEYEKFINCAGEGFPASEKPHYGSKELACCRPASVGQEQIESARRILGGEVVSDE